MNDYKKININFDVPHWWYHYYSTGNNKKIKELAAKHFTLSNSKYTPDFQNFIYNYGICHPQIGTNVVPKKTIILIKTTVGIDVSGYFQKTPFVVGYFRVSEIDRDKEVIFIDKSESLLLLDNPIKINPKLAQELFNNKNKKYWNMSEKFVRRIGSYLRNRKARPNEVKYIVSEFIKRYNAGAKNYFGENYLSLK